VSALAWSTALLINTTVADRRKFDDIIIAARMKHVMVNPVRSKFRRAVADALEFATSNQENRRAIKNLRAAQAKKVVVARSRSMKHLQELRKIRHSSMTR